MPIPSPGGFALCPEVTAVAKKTKKAKPAKLPEKKMVRVSDADHLLLTQMAEENNRTLAAENHRALQDYFLKHGKTPPKAKD